MAKFNLSNGYLYFEDETMSRAVEQLIGEEFFWEFLSDLVAEYLDNYDKENDLKALVESNKANDVKLEEIMKALSSLQSTVKDLQVAPAPKPKSNVVGASNNNKKSGKPKETSKFKASPSGKSNKKKNSENAMSGASLFDAFNALIPEPD